MLAYNLMMFAIVAACLAAIHLGFDERQRRQVQRRFGNLIRSRRCGPLGCCTRGWRLQAESRFDPHATHAMMESNLFSTDPANLTATVQRIYAASRVSGPNGSANDQRVSDQIKRLGARLSSTAAKHAPPEQPLLSLLRLMIRVLEHDFRAHRVNP